MSCLGLAHLIVQHFDAIAKHPAQAVWISFAGGALACFGLAARLLRRDEPGAFKVAHLAAPWAGSALAMAALWMMLPAAAVPIAWGLLAIVVAEAGVASGAMNLLALGSLISLSAAAICLDTATGRLGNGAVAVEAGHAARAHASTCWRVQGGRVDDRERGSGARAAWW